MIVARKSGELQGPAERMRDLGLLTAPVESSLCLCMETARDVPANTRKTPYRALEQQMVARFACRMVTGAMERDRCSLLAGVRRIHCKDTEVTHK